MFKRTIVIVMLSIFVSGHCRLRTDGDKTYIIRNDAKEDAKITFKCQNTNNISGHPNLTAFVCNGITIAKTGERGIVEAKLCTLFIKDLSIDVNCDADGEIKPVKGKTNELCHPPGEGNIIM